MPTQPTKKHSDGYTKYTRNLALMMCLGMLAGVLIWAKLRLVTDIPRSAYADPRETQIQQLSDSESDQLELLPVDDAGHVEQTDSEDNQKSNDE